MPFIEDEQGVPVIVFGQGDVTIGPMIFAEDANISGIVFQDGRIPREVGSVVFDTRRDSCETCMESKCKLVFDRVESIDVVIEALLCARYALMGIEKTEKELRDAVARLVR